MIQAEWTRGVRKDIQISVDGTAVPDQITALTYTDDINGDSGSVRIGSACAAAVEFTVAEPSVSYAGAVLEISIAGVPLGSFTVTGTRERDGRLAVTAADAMAGSAMQEYFEPSASSGTALGVIREIASGADLTLADVSGISDVPVSGLSIGCSRREMLGRMAAVLGRNAHIDRYGKLCLRWYENNGGAVGPGDIYAGGIEKGEADYEIEKIECSVTTLTQITEDGTTTEQTQTVTLAAGEGSMGISLDCPYMTQELLDGIYARLGGFTFRPMTLEMYGDARIKTGDILTVTDTDGTVYTVPVMGVTHIWDGGVRTTVKAAGEIAAGENGQLQGTLSQAVTRLEAELARFRNLEAENITVLRGRIGELFADWAHIGEAIIETLSTTAISADWIDFKYINCTGLPPVICPNEFDPDSLFPGQTVENGWIRGGTIVKGSGRDTLAFIDGKRIELSFETKGPISGGSEVINDFEHAWQGAGGGTYAVPAYYEDGTPIYVYKYTYDFTGQSEDPEEYDPRGDYLWYFQVWVDAAYVRRVTLLDAGAGNVLLGPSGLEIGDFSVDRAGNVTAVDGHLGALYLNSCDDGVTEVGAALTRTAGTIAITSGSLDGSAGELVKQGKAVTMNFVTSGTEITTGWRSIGSVPSAFAPGAIALGVGLTGYTPVHVRVLTGGQIQVRGATAAANQGLRTNMSWMTA